MDEQKKPQKSSVGDLDENVASLIAYLFGLISGLVFFFMEKNSRLVKFHAMQAILTTVALVVIWVVVSIILTIIALIPLLGFIISMLGFFALGAGTLALWIILMLKAYKCEWFKLPVIGDIAEKQANI